MEAPLSFMLAGRVAYSRRVAYCGGLVSKIASEGCIDLYRDAAVLIVLTDCVISGEVESDVDFCEDVEFASTSRVGLKTVGDSIADCNRSSPQTSRDEASRSLQPHYGSSRCIN